MKVQIVSGFLGAGKTTLVKQLLAKAGPGTAVLVNEYGELGIDGDLLTGEKIDLLELPSGCICCSLKTDLIQGINELYRKAKPQKLIIEPSGMATLSGILEAIASPNIEADIEFEAIITVVEPDVFLEDLAEGAFGNFFHDQLGNADIILVNKCDLNPPEKIEHTIRELAKLNPYAAILPSKYCEITLPELTGTGQVKIKGAAKKLDSVTLKKAGIFSSEKVTELLRNVIKGHYGLVYRAKGFFQEKEGNYHFELVRGNWELLPWEKSIIESKFIFIGQDLGDFATQLDLLVEN